MKQLITTALIIFFFNSCIAQKKGAFLRVFDNNDKQIYAGHLDGVTDSSFFLVIRRSKKEIPIREVNYLKLKHSVGHSIATVGGVSAVSLAIAGYFSGEPKVITEHLRVSSMIYLHLPLQKDCLVVL